MTTSLDLVTRHFPARIAELGFSAELPADWISHPLPDDEVDFSDPTAFVPLVIVTAPHAAIVYAFAARPAHDDGTLHDWAWYHLQQQQPLQPRAIGRDVVAGVAAVVGEAVQASDLGPVHVRFAFLEDGDRLVQFSLSAPELLADVMRDAWFALLRSFALETARGSRFAIEPHPDHAPAAPIPEPWLDTAPPTETAVPAVLDAETGEPLLISTALPDPLAPDAAAAGREIGDFALDSDSIALDEDHATNVRLRKLGLGEVPAIAGLSDSQRRATLAASAIQAEFDLPYGWHALDDGRRTLVFDPQERVRIELSLVMSGTNDAAGLLASIETRRRAEQAAVRFDRREIDGRPALLAHLEAGDGEPRDELHLLHPWIDESRWLHAQVSAQAHQADAARQLLRLMLASLVYLPQAATTGDQVTDRGDTRADQASTGASIQEPPAAHVPPDWWQGALALEAADELAAAEALIRDQVPHLGFAASIAQMYRLRMLRLQAAGNTDGAREAYTKSRDFIGFYASMATSGGEGAALSLERDDFMAQLDAEYRGQPRARA